MNLAEFIEEFKTLLDEVPEELNVDTKFRDLDDWSSLTALALIAMADDSFNKQIGAKEIEESITIGDLFNILSS